MSAAATDLSVDSVTGIPVALRVAGPGVRAYAFLIDWHIRLVLALAWFAAASLLYNGRLSLSPPSASEPRWFALVLAPALAIFLVYHLVLEFALRGRTPGKRVAGVRIVDRHGGVPSAGALLARNVFRLIDSLPLFYGVGLIAVIVSAEHLRVGDLAAGTLLVYESAPTFAAPELEHLAPQVDAQDAEIAAELLGRWSGLGSEARLRLARTLLARSGIDAPQLQAMDVDALQRALRRLAGATATAP
jgi:uncharacterized RDD family membrane protein YckC